MKRLADFIMRRRAKRLVRRLQPFLPDRGTVADIGSGTGHNAELLRSAMGLDTIEFDVEDMHWTGTPPKLIQNGVLPAGDSSADVSLLLFVLQYPTDPAALLAEARRITRGRIIVVQSTFDGPLAHAVLRLREFFYGRFGFRLARWAGLISAGHCPLSPTHYFSRDSLVAAFEAAGLSVEHFEPQKKLLVRLSRDLFILRRRES